MTSRETIHAELLDAERIQCHVCPRRCVIPSGERGVCGIRENTNGTLTLLTYGKTVSAAVDPIEKKPLFHFAPGSSVMSIATRGCNLRCDFCQNYSIALEADQRSPREQQLPPEQLATRLSQERAAGMAYTYTEPTIFLEYAYDTMNATTDENYNVFVSNGYMTPETAKTLGPHLDAINVDIKGDQSFYREYCGIPDPEPIYDALEILAEHDVWIEITNLLVTGENTDMETIADRMEWIVDALGPQTPVHFSRFRPAYNMTDTPPTPVDTIESAIGVAEDTGLHYVYSGNIPGHESESTVCPNCNTTVIKRNGFEIQEYNLRDGRCPTCNRTIPIAGRQWAQGTTTSDQRLRNL